MLHYSHCSLFYIYGMQTINSLIMSFVKVFNSSLVLSVFNHSSIHLVKMHLVSLCQILDEKPKVQKETRLDLVLERRLMTILVDSSLESADLVRYLIDVFYCHGVII